MSKTRKNDFLKQKSNSLSKEASRYTPIKGITIFGGSSLIGPHISDSKKISFLTRHDHKEYFAMEILQLLGVNTPKIRLIGNDVVASRNIEGYLPMICFRDDVPVTFDKDTIMKWRSLYKLDMKRQVVIDLEKKQELKVNGETFAANLLFMLIRDCDPQVAGLNFGLMHIGNRFCCYAIDKDKVNFDGKKFEDALKDELFSSCTLEQKLTIADRVLQALIPDDKGFCAFDRIFLNERVLATPSLNKHAKTYCDNFKKTASSFIDYCNSIYGKDCIPQFREREKMRIQLAESVVTKAKIDVSWIPAIVNDLKAVYYANFFGTGAKNFLSKKNKKALINKLIYDIKQEIGSTLKVDTTASKMDTQADVVSKKRKAPEETKEKEVKEDEREASVKRMRPS